MDVSKTLEHHYKFSVSLWLSAVLLRTHGKKTNTIMKQFTNWKHTLQRAESRKAKHLTQAYHSRAIKSLAMLYTSGSLIALGQGASDQVCVSSQKHAQNYNTSV